MSWKVEHNDKLGIITLTYKGFMSAMDYFDSTIRAIELSNQKKIYRGLIDSRRVQTNVAKADLFKFPFSVYNDWGLNKSARIAVIEPLDQAARDLNSFFIISCNNLGWRAQSFAKRKNALKWLLEDN